MISNAHLITFPEIKKYKLINLLNNDEHYVTDVMLENAFADRPEELMKVRSNRSNAWFLEEVFD
ncbi:hypothetical protein MYO4S_00037 [Serratia phage 4S]|nr:hypothetical protein MYO4S_00037 [Serratia phage 4S]